MSRPLRLLLLGDTHLGFDLPMRPRIEMRRRGEDFFVAFAQALEIGRAHDVDAVIHAGDVFHRSHPPEHVIYRAFEPLLRIADGGVPVLLVPGNHERAALPESLFALHELIYLFDRPRSVLLTLGGVRCRFDGFPFVRHGIRERFPEMLNAVRGDRGAKGGEGVRAHVLCMHQTVSGATVGVSNYTFRAGPDVIPREALPWEYDVIASGHIHRHQILPVPGSSQDRKCVVCYPGSIDRTSFDERDETKGVVIIKITPRAAEAPLVSVEFCPLATRPMVSIDLPGTSLEGDVIAFLHSRLAEFDPDSVVRIRIVGEFDRSLLRRVSAPILRRIAPPTMNVSLSVPTDCGDRKRIG